MVKKGLAIIKVLLTGVFSFVFFLVILLFLQGDWKEGRGPELFGWTSYTILSNSMQPTFSAGDVVIMKPVTTLQKQDVVTYMTPQRQFFTHRIIGSSQTDGQLVYETQGDNNQVPDEDTIVKEQVVGVHAFTIPYLGTVAAYIKQPIGYGTVIILPIFIWISLTLYEKYTKKRREDSCNENKII
ncbi:signal peptidase SipW, required for TasA secretion [Bacillus sp. JCM 19046]|nr:signal peptidase SipW, required for TasA secretion [Bacillus sp. JCM 19045]GAF16132.1 signal peptidase SipW, required for TasA secretion [Bacillus sp. JCM 19046]